MEVRQTTRSAPEVTRRRTLAAAAVAGLAAVAVTACGGSGGGDTNTLTVVYRQFGANEVQKNYLAGVKAEFEAANPGLTVDLQPIVAGEAEYPTKLQLLMRSARSAPDLIYEDTFQINSDIDAGYLRPLDDKIAGWADWANFNETAKKGGTSLEGKVYGIPDGTDTRGIWFNKQIFAKAGLPADWAPKNWDDILAAARAVKAAVPDVQPLNVYAGKGVGEASSMQGFEMLLYGTNDTLYDESTRKWIIGSKGFKDSLTFLDTIYEEGLAASPQQVLDPTWASKVSQQLIPQGKLAIAVDGSFTALNWQPTGAVPWPEWSTVMSPTAMPTQTGQGAGRISLSGGWTWAIPQNSDNQDKAWELITLLSDKKHQLQWAIENVQIPVRDDVASDPTYLAANPTNAFFAGLVKDTKYRPAYSVYPRVSSEIQVATEKVITGAAGVDQAAAEYDEAVRSITNGEVAGAPGS
ncbi:extracellular solute-binding protein [Actinomycetes bacterium KLBMP 9759]